MNPFQSLPGPITVLLIVIVLAAAATWIIPAGEYDKLSMSEDGARFMVTGGASGAAPLPLTDRTLDSLGIRIPLEKFTGKAIRKPVGIPGSYHPVDGNPQGLLGILQAPIKGIYDTIDIILFILVIGGFMQVFNASGAMVRGIAALSVRMRGRESWLVVLLTFLFSFAGSSYGMAEEALVFYPILVPLFLAAGYDLLVPLMVIFGGTQLGTLSSISNPFSTIIASNAAGVNWMEGLNERILMFVVSTGIAIWYTVRYAQRVKKDPASSIVLRTDGAVHTHYEMPALSADVSAQLDWRTRGLLLVFLFTFLGMIGGVIFLEWWLLEMTMLFLASTMLLGLLLRLPEKKLVGQFIKGAEELLSVAFIVGIARGVTLVLNEGRISDSMLYYAAQWIGHMPPALFVVLLLCLFLFLTLFIASSSGMAVLTMPIIGALAVVVQVPGQETVNAYLYGMGIMGFLTPTGLLLPSLAMVNVSLAAWWRFIRPLLLLLFILCAAFLIAGTLFHA
ncbi:MAG: hypothetical protein SFV52_01220 [Saprospiraceae bacterium]|nr:hypothetical protein [Saprospiraceae bacterium]